MNLPRRVRELLTRVRGVPAARHALARVRRARYERRIRRFVTERTGRADRLPSGVVYEPTMRCNLRCEFCYVGELLNPPDAGQRELTLDALRAAFPDGPLELSLTGGEVFVRHDILDVLGLFREKGYRGGYLTTNATIIDERRAEALADLAAAGFVGHFSVSIDGPDHLHDVARGVPGTFARAAAGLRALQEAARRKGTPLRISINTVVAPGTLEALDQMATVAEELGVDAIALNHLMFSTPDEVADTVRLVGANGPGAIATWVTRDPGVRADRVRAQVSALAAKCRQRNIRFDFRPKVGEAVMDRYYSPGAPLEGRCLYPFLHARVSFNGKVHFCPMIRVEVGDLKVSTLEEVWNGERYVELRRRLLAHGLFPVCRRCCKAELADESRGID